MAHRRIHGHVHRMATTAHSPESRLKAHGRDLGFDDVRLARIAETWASSDRLEAFVAAGRHGDMTWMETTLARRRHPQAMWPEARTAVVVGLNYGPGRDPLGVLAQREVGAVSVYAQNADYHDVLKRRLRVLASDFARRERAEVKIFVDTAPLMEKPLAEAAGLGWQGKHTNLVSRAHGAWLFLGVMLTSAELAADAPEADHCGVCRACLDVCPTRAFPAPNQLDARRCISYLTIEHAGPIPREFRVAMGNRIYGCDDCLAVCPWNKFAQTARESAFHPRPELVAPLLEELAQLDESVFRSVFAGSPVRRIGRDRLVRNVMIAIGNSGATRLAEICRVRLEDDSPLVRGAAAWALGRLSPAAFLAEGRTRRPQEGDPAVLAEWNQDPALD
jgi:epoxyqueuosine reductase